MKETVISWTFVNWVTIVLMFLLALAVFGLVVKLWKSAKDGSSS